MDYIPTQRLERYEWWKKIRDSIETEGPKFGLSPANISAAKALAADQCAAMEAVDAAETALKGARARETAVTPVNTAGMRACVRHWKTLPDYPASGSEGALKLRGPKVSFDPAAFKSVLKVSIVGGQIRLDFTRSGVGAVVVYARLRGTPDWSRLGQDSSSPYYDTRPLTVPGVAEMREYMVRGLLDDEEIGQDSNIVSILFGG
jgi:hypothetical protein